MIFRAKCGSFYHSKSINWGRSGVFDIDPYVRNVGSLKQFKALVVVLDTSTYCLAPVPFARHSCCEGFKSLPLLLRTIELLGVGSYRCFASLKMMGW